MSFQVAGHQTEGYTVATELFSGPLDLLLELIERAELDITQMALAQVTDQYLAYLHDLQDQNAAEVSAFLVIAARLLQIKSAALLPKPVVAGPAVEEDNAEALVQQLIQYRKFKQAASRLEGLDLAGNHAYLRIAPPSVQVETRLDVSDLTLAGLIEAARSVFLGSANLKSLDKVVTMPRITIREKIQVILETLRHGAGATFRTVLRSHNRVEVVITFLAMLELIKRNIIEAQQTSLFDDIRIQPLQDVLEGEEFELEFE